MEMKSNGEQAKRKKRDPNQSFRRLTQKILNQVVMRDALREVCVEP